MLQNEHFDIRTMMIIIAIVLKTLQIKTTIDFLIENAIPLFERKFFKAFLQREFFRMF